MPIGFVIMQIGNDELDGIYANVIEHAIRDAGLEPRRVDRHNQGGLLKSEIVGFINDADIIIADLTNERPNVYLEVGYTMGVDKFRNLILTARADHLPGNDGWTPTGPKIHFDLAGYDILLWSPGNLDGFREELTRRIKRRRALTNASGAPTVPVLDQKWIQQHREYATGRISELGTRAYFELVFGLAPPKPDVPPMQLRDAAEKANIQTFGWPIGVVLHVEQHRPKPRTDGVVAEIVADRTEPSFDYWALRRNGDYYLLASLFEDQRDPEAIFFNTRIVRTTESLMFLLRLYDQMGVDRSSQVEVQISYGGFGGRYLSSSSNRPLARNRIAAEDQISMSFSGTLDEIEAELPRVVEHLTAPLFSLFDFYEFSPKIYDDIVGAFVEGRVT